MAPLLPGIARGLGTTASWVGRAVSGYAVAAAVAALVAGPLSDRLGRRPFLAGASALLGLGSAVSAATSSFTGFALARVATGAGAGVISALSIAAIADVVPYERRGRSMGWVATAYTAAPIFGVPIATWAAEAFGWRANFVAFAASGAFLGLAVQAWLREGDRPAVGEAGSAPLPLLFRLAGDRARGFVGVLHHRRCHRVSAVPRRLPAEGDRTHARPGRHRLPRERSRESRRGVRRGAAIGPSRKDPGRPRRVPVSVGAAPRRSPCERAAPVRDARTRRGLGGGASRLRSNRS